jgi:hypothetical protein
MSRRHRGRPHHHAPAGSDGPRRNTGTEPAGSPAPDATAPRTAAAAPPRLQQQAPPRSTEPRADTQTAGAVNRPAHDREPMPPTHAIAPNGAAASPTPATATEPAAQPQNGDRLGQCTAPQLRRFIKSRPYVPMHELRRRFAINGDDDDVTPVRLNPGWIYVGLPTHEGHLLGELLRTGEIGYELSLDPRTPIVIGVYPMRPIPRS